MRHFAHLVRWDVRRFRAILAVWLLVVVATTTLDMFWPQLAAERTTRQLVGTIGNLLALTQVLLSAVLIAQVVHAHALVGTTAFWMTRPVPPGSLLNAKLALLGATMVAAPVLCNAVAMATYHVPTRDIVGVAIQSSLLWALWIGALATAAALTPNLAKFALLIGTGLIATIVSLSVLLTVAMYRYEEGPPLGQRTLDGQSAMWRAPDPTPDLIGTVLTFVALLVLLMVQYRSRRRALSFAVGVAGVLMAVLVSSAWRWPFLAPDVSTPTWASTPAALVLGGSGDTVLLEASPSFRDQPIDWRQARAPLRLRGIEPGWTARVGVRSAVVQMPNGTQLTSTYVGPPSLVEIEEHGDAPQQRAVVRNLLGVATLIDQQDSGRSEDTIVLFAKGIDISRIAPARGAYQGHFYVGLTRHTIEAVLPATRGVLHQNGPYRFSIANTQLRSGNVSILSEQSDAVSPFVRRPPVMRSFYLRNQRTSEAVHLPSYDLRMEASLLRFLPFAIGFSEGTHSGFTARAEMLFFAPRAEETNISIALDEQWFNQAELVIVQTTPAGSVERQLAIADFPIRAE